MLPAEEPGTSEGRTPATNQTVRTVFVIGPDKKIKLMLTYPMTTGRNFDEILRVIDSLQLTAKHKVSTPVNWKHGDDVIIAGSVSDDDAKDAVPGRMAGAEALYPHRQAAGRDFLAGRSSGLGSGGRRAPGYWSWSAGVFGGSELAQHLAESPCGQSQVTISDKSDASSLASRSRRGVRAA